MTRWQRHLLQIRHIPRTQYNPPIIRIMLQLMYNLRQLIYSLPRIIGLSVHVLGAEMAPLETVDRTQVADRAVRETYRIEVFTGSVAVPDFYACVGEREGGGVAGDEPEEFGEDGA